MDGRRRTRQVVDLVDLQQDRFGYVMANQFKAMAVQQAVEVLLSAGKEVIEADDLVTLRQQAFTQM